MLIHDITAIFDQEVRRLFKDQPKVKEFILNHERKNLCIENLDVEIRKMQLVPTFTLLKNDFEFIVKSYAYTFAHAALKEVEERKMHYLEKQKKIDEAREFEEIKTMFESEDHSYSLDDKRQGLI